MLRRVRVKYFKSIASLDISLGRINVFIGANGSGKSNLLEAVGVLGASAFGRVDDEALLRRGVRPGVPRLYKAAFVQTTNAKHILFNAQSDNGASYQVTLWNPIKEPSPAWKFKTEDLIRGNNDRVVARGPAGKVGNPEQGLAALQIATLPDGDSARTLMDALRNYSIYCPNTPSLRNLVPDTQSRDPVGLAGGRLPEAVKELIEFSRKNRTIRDRLLEVTEMVDWCQSFSSVPSALVPLSPSAARSPLVIQFIDRYMVRSRNILSAYDASEGALYILFCAVLALHPKAPPFLAIDNFDQALNPRLATKLTAAICSWISEVDAEDRQWLLTAHNPAVLDGLPLGDPNVRLFAVERDNHGQTRFRHIDIATAIRQRPNKEWTLSRMWVNGYLGAVPNV